MEKYTYTKTCYRNGKIDYATISDEFRTAGDAIADARRVAMYWKLHYDGATGVLHASYMDTQKGATTYIEMADGRSILTYYELN